MSSKYIVVGYDRYQKFGKTVYSGDVFRRALWALVVAKKSGNVRIVLEWRP